MSTLRVVIYLACTDGGSELDLPGAIVKELVRAGRERVWVGWKYNGCMLLLCIHSDTHHECCMQLDDDSSFLVLRPTERGHS